MSRRLQLDGPEADSLETLEADGAQSTLRRRMQVEEAERKEAQHAMQRRVVQSIRLTGSNVARVGSVRAAKAGALLETLRGSVRVQRLSLARSSLSSARSRSVTANGEEDGDQDDSSENWVDNPLESSENSPLVSRYGQIDVTDEALELQDGSYNVQIFEDVARFGDDHETAHPLLSGPREFYRVFPGKVALLVRLLNLCASGDTRFTAGSLYVRCAQTKSSWMGKKLVQADPEERDFSRLRMYDDKTFPALVQDFQSPACFVAQTDGRQQVFYDAITEEIPFKDLIVVNRVSLGIARAAEHAYALYEQEGKFSLEKFWSAPARSQVINFAHRLGELLEHMLRLPQAFPISHIGGFRHARMHRYTIMVPTAVKMNPPSSHHRAQEGSRATSVQRGGSQGTRADLRLDAYEICEVIPRKGFEAIVLAECTSSVEESHALATLKGSTLLVSSPLFAYYVRGGGPQYPDPDYDLTLAVSMFFGQPCVDRTGTIVDHEVRLSPADPLPRVHLGSQTRRYVDGVLVSAVQDAFDNLAMATPTILWQAVEDSGVSALMQEGAARIMQQIEGGNATDIEILLDEDPATIAALFALVDLGWERFQRNQILIRVVYVARAVPEEVLAAVEGLRASNPAWEHIVELYAYENADLSEMLSLDDCVVVSCAHADLVFGSPHYQSFFVRQKGNAFCGAEAGAGQLDSKWQAAVRKEIQRRNVVSANNTESLLRLLRLQADLAPFTLVTLRDYLWWANFTMLWNKASVDLISRIPSMNARRVQNVFQFYRSDGWQRWALDITHHAKLKFPRSKSGHQAHHYKLLLKAFTDRVCASCGVGDRERAGLMCSNPFATGGAGDAHFQAETLSSLSTAFAVTSDYEVVRFGRSSHLLVDLQLAYAGDALAHFLRSS
ncbi:Hypothetical Protein FCC1311_096762 [Hondaea fermentalgiana]|uniref:Uncharacterized protein n=1 Tax=Hondaea fermentalgiana TaxID=2315210 RepID=A0A2R5GXM5_9STRA|nr:Hypothetical Protein FCC1311_096762 [Hondaea fermentalgiana]|eukprot:GBG33453.1 Hypothetical Protein FCC1311_096762 [Hondaea fermentalgiana]